MTHIELRTGRKVPVIEPEPTLSGEPLWVAPVRARIEPAEGWTAMVQCTWCGRRCWVTFAQLGDIPEGHAAAPVCVPCAEPFAQVHLPVEGPCTCQPCRQRRAPVAYTNVTGEDYVMADDR